jgi:hypothetical protein
MVNILSEASASARNHPTDLAKAPTPKSKKGGSTAMKIPIKLSIHAYFRLIYLNKATTLQKLIIPTEL